ncbi:hypothetical protein [Hoyosella altamirensis]|nr:hypothetical protein [Hoyosella altamirensis]
MDRAAAAFGRGVFAPAPAARRVGAAVQFLIGHGGTVLSFGAAWAG